MRRGFAVATVLGSVVAALGWMASPALAIPTCPNSVARDYVSAAWYPGDNQVAGMRAPIEMRKDGAVCSGGPEAGAASAWVAINKSDGSAITQIGFLHVYNSALQVGQYCRFWAIDGGGVHSYGCGNQTDSVVVYFEVLKFYDPDTKQYKYLIYDCGSAGGYSSCTAKNSSELAYSSAFGVVSAETNYGRSACTIRIMGNPDHKQSFGTTQWHIEGLHDLGGSWGTKTLIGSNATCSNYGGDFTNSIVHTWDSRNTT